MLVELLEGVGKALIRAAILAVLNPLYEEQATPEPRVWYPQLPGTSADEVLLRHLDDMDRCELEANQVLQHGRRDDDAW